MVATKYITKSNVSGNYFVILSVRMVISVPLPTIQSETWLVHAKVREPHLNPPFRMNFLPLTFVLEGKANKVRVQMWFANFHVNKPCFRLDCSERY